MLQKLMGFFDVRRDELYRIGIMASLLFFLVAANNLIKIVRDSVFLSHHSVSELPYLYILVAFIAGALIAVYGRYTANLPVYRLILTTNLIIISTIIFFWALLSFFDPGWSHYAFYIWSAIAGAIAVAQLWTLANEIFSAREGQRVFGFVAAGGTIGGAIAGFGTKWLVALSLDINHLLWLVAGLFLAASALVFGAHRHLKSEIHETDLAVLMRSGNNNAKALSAHLRGSRYIKSIAVVILVSVIVSTLIDFELKVAAKEAYSSKQMLAGFFGSYYAWLSIATFFSQTVLTGRTLSRLGLFPSLYLRPGVLLAGTLSIMISPGLLIAALTKMADSALRNSIHRSGMEVVFMALPHDVRKLVRSFLDVVVERLGDAAAGFIIFFYSLFSTEPKLSYIHLICVGLIVIWMLLIPLLRIGHVQAGVNELEPHETASKGWSADSKPRQPAEL